MGRPHLSTAHLSSSAARLSSSAAHYTPQLLALTRVLAAIIYVAALHALAAADTLIQRAASATGIPRLAILKRQSVPVRRRLNRLLVALLSVGLALGTLEYRHRVYAAQIQIPILGWGENDLGLYYPPIGAEHLPRVAEYNVYRRRRPRTPLFIPYTRNNTMLTQAVLSYIAAGWPRSDIVIVENTGTMDANPRGQLTPSNPFFLDHERFRKRYGVSILQTPTLLNFAQLQNFLLRIALARGWAYFFWSHMDIAVLSAEEFTPYKSFYHRVIDLLDSVGLPLSTVHPRPPQAQPTSPPGPTARLATHLSSYLHTPTSVLSSLKPSPNWATKFFDFDNLALINVSAWSRIGPWDVFVPYYNTDCDAYARAAMHGYGRDDVQAGYIFDVAEAVADPEARFFPSPSRAKRREWGAGPGAEEPQGGRLLSWRYQWLKAELAALMLAKNSNVAGRNTWQGGGDKARPPREKWSHEARAFQAAWWSTADYGRAMYVRKWGTLECDLVGNNKTLKDAWLQEYLDEESEEYKERMKEEEKWNGVLAESAIR